MISRREFLTIVGGVTVVGLSACSSDGQPSRSGSATTPASGASTSAAVPGGTAAATSSPGTTATGASGTTGSAAATAGSTTANAKHGKTLVVVQLNGGNDGLNTLIPSDGRYHDLRPTLAIPEAQRISLAGNNDFTLHPALAPLAALFAAKRLAFVEGVGFPDQDHSHFVALDQWWRADRMSSSEGWLGSYLRTLPTTDPLYATALNSGAPLLSNPKNQPAVVFRPAAFQFNKTLSDDVLLAMTTPLSADPLQAAAQTTLARSVAAVNSFADMLASSQDDDQPAGQEREGGGTIAGGLQTAAKLITSNPATRIVVVSAGGFDTHANQLATQADLLADLAAGLQGFATSIDKAGLADDVLLVTTSEFGRRAAENGSGGTDHGSGGVSFVLGSTINPGVHGTADLANLQNGDVRAGVDPRSIYTACLDWLGGDPATVLGKRYDDVKLLA